MPWADLRALIGIAAAFCAANVCWWLQPALMQQLVESRHLSDSSAGLLLSIELACLALASAVAARWVTTVRMLARGALLGVAVAAVACALSAVAPGHYGLLLLLRALSGAGAGVALAAANRAAAGSSDPDRSFSWIGIANVGVGAGLMTLLPLIPGSPANAPFVLMVGAFVVLGLASGLLPSVTAAAAVAPATGQRHRHAPPTRSMGLRLVLVALSTFAVGVCSGVVWAYYGVIATQAGLPAGEVEAAIGTAIFAAGAGAGLSAMVRNRFGRAFPVVIGLGGLAWAVVLLSQSPSAGTFRVASCVHMASIFFLFPHFLGAAAAEDPAGQGAVYVSSAFFLSGAVSPFLGGLLVETVGIRQVGVGVALISAIAAAIFIALVRSRPTLPMGEPR